MYEAGDTLAGDAFETVNVKKMQRDLAKDISGDPERMRAHRDRHFRHGERKGDWSRVRVSHYRKHHLPGRRYARGPSLQSMKSSDRELIQDEEVFAVDMHASVPTISRRGTRELQGYEQNTYQHWDVHNQYSYDWRDFVAEYYIMSPADTKKEILKLFSRGLPRSDLPFLWALAG